MAVHDSGGYHFEVDLSHPRGQVCQILERYYQVEEERNMYFHALIERGSEINSKDAQILNLEKLLTLERSKNELLQLTLVTYNLKLEDNHIDDDFKRGLRVKGRFKVNTKSIECKQCHQVFGSHDEMRASQCFFHPVNPVANAQHVFVSGTTGSYYYSCCRQTCGKAPPGCQKGMHVPN